MGIASGPAALCGFTFCRSLGIPTLHMLNAAIWWIWTTFHLRDVVGVLFVNALENCWLSITAFVLGLLCRSPSLLSGPIPLLSHLLVLMKENSFFGSSFSDTMFLM